MRLEDACWENTKTNFLDLLRRADINFSSESMNLEEILDRSCCSAQNEEIQALMTLKKNKINPKESTRRLSWSEALNKKVDTINMSFERMKIA